MNSPAKNSLQAVLNRTSSQPEPAKPKAARVARPKPAEDEGRFFRPSREGKKLVSGHFDPKVAKQLKLIMVEEDTTVQALLEEALNLLFVKKGKATIDRL